MRSFSAALRNPHHAGAAWDPCNQYSLGDIPQRFPSEKQRSFSLGRLLYPLYPAGPKIGGRLSPHTLRLMRRLIVVQLVTLPLRRGFLVFMLTIQQSSQSRDDVGGNRAWSGVVSTVSIYVCLFTLYSLQTRLKIVYFKKTSRK